MKGAWLRLLFFLLCVGAAGATVSYRLYAAGQAQQQEAWRLLQPESRQGPAPAYTVYGLDGRPISSRELSGQTLLVNFWATWCTPCLQELPHLARLARDLNGEPIRLLLISVDEDRSAVRDLVNELSRQGAAGRASAELLQGRPALVLSLWDPDAKMAESLGTSRYPETYLIDPQGRLRYRFVGPKPWGRKSVRAWLEEQCLLFR